MSDEKFADHDTMLRLIAGGREASDLRTAVLQLLMRIEELEAKMPTSASDSAPAKPPQR